MPTPSFETDPYSGRTKILFIGSGKSTHTHAWIDLLQNERFNVRLFSTEGAPPDSWWAKTYITEYPGPAIDSETRLGLFNKRRALRATERLIARVHRRSWNPEQKVFNWLAEIIDQWRPHIVHTLGLEPAGYLYARVLKQTHSTNGSRWVAQVRGGPDLALNRLLPEYQPLIKSVFASVIEYWLTISRTMISHGGWDWTKSKYRKSAACRGPVEWMLIYWLNSVRAIHPRARQSFGRKHMSVRRARRFRYSKPLNCCRIVCRPVMCTCLAVKRYSTRFGCGSKRCRQIFARVRIWSIASRVRRYFAYSVARA